MVELLNKFKMRPMLNSFEVIMSVNPSRRTFRVDVLSTIEERDKTMPRLPLSLLSNISSSAVSREPQTVSTLSRISDKEVKNSLRSSASSSSRAGKCSIAPCSAIVLRRARVRGSVYHAIWRIFLVFHFPLPPE